jgi:hypothetical protein
VTHDSSMSGIKIGADWAAWTDLRASASETPLSGGPLAIASVNSLADCSSASSSSVGPSGGGVLLAGEAEFHLPRIVHLDDLPVALGDTRWIKGSACHDLSSDREGCDSNAIWA